MHLLTALLILWLIAPRVPAGEVLVTVLKPDRIAVLMAVDARLSEGSRIGPASVALLKEASSGL